MGIPNESRTRRSRWTLARRLAALFVELLAVIVLAFTAAAYHGVREQAELRATERMASVVRELAVSGARSTAARASALREMARDTIMQRAITTDTSGGSDDHPTRQVMGARPAPRVAATVTSPVSASALAALFAARRRPADTTHLGWQLLDRAGGRRYGEVLDGRDSAILSAAVCALVALPSSPCVAMAQHIVNECA